MIKEINQNNNIIPEEYLETILEIKQHDLKITNVSVNEYDHKTQSKGKLTLTYEITSEVNINDIPVKPKPIIYNYDLKESTSFIIVAGQGTAPSCWEYPIKSDDGQIQYRFIESCELHSILINAIKEKGYKVNNEFILTTDEIKDILTGYEFKGIFEEDNREIKIKICLPRNKNSLGVGASGGVKQ